MFIDKVVSKYRQAMLSFLSLLGSREFLFATLLWFIFQAGWIAFSTAGGFAPDEGMHIKSIQLYATHSLSPLLTSQPEGTYSLGAVTRSPSYLYHYLMSLPYRALPAELGQEGILIALRLINVLFPIVGLVVLYRAMIVLSAPRAVAGLVIWMLSNTLMFVFLAGSVSYDNLEFLLSTVAFYYWAKLYTAPHGRDLLKLAITMCAASITKFTFLPLGATLLVLLALRYRKRFREVGATCLSTLQPMSGTTACLAALFLLFFGLFIERYGVNYVRYGSYKPQCDQVLTYDQCMQSALFRRNIEFRNKPVSSSIPDPSFVYKWARKMKRGVFAIVGHSSTRQDPFIKSGTALILASMLLAVIVTSRQRDALQFSLVTIVGVYAVILLLHNYHLFSQSGRFGMALQGRYIFPVLGILYFVGVSALVRISAKLASVCGLCALVIFGVFLLGGLPRYIKTTTPAWHIASMVDINREVKELLSAVP
jgi:hypothetical protein